jgi:hypothetical protein
MIEGVAVPSHMRLKECNSCHAYYMFIHDPEVTGDNRDWGIPVESLKIKPTNFWFDKKEVTS